MATQNDSAVPEEGGIEILHATDTQEKPVPASESSSPRREKARLELCHEILADDKLKPVFGKEKVTMFEMNRYLAQHLK